MDSEQGHTAGMDCRLDTTRASLTTHQL